MKESLGRANTFAKALFAKCRLIIMMSGTFICAIIIAHRADLRGGTTSERLGRSPFYLNLQILSSQIRLTKQIKIRDEKMKEDQISQIQIKVKIIS